MAIPSEHANPAAPSAAAWIVAIGASGSAGLDNIKHLLAGLPADLNAILLIVLHRQFDRPSHLAEVLGRATALPVMVAEDGEKFARGCCYIGEPAAHLVLATRSFGDLVEDPGATYRNRTVDLLFRSLAAHAGRCSIGVILSGSLDDGSRGIAAIHQAGGMTMVVTPGTALGSGMPESAIRYDGPIDTIGSPQQIAEAILRLVGQ
jgi:chemotaxis response regulator CheB